MIPVVAALRNAFAAHADAALAGPMQAYMKSEMPYLGVPMPACRKIWRSGFDVSLDQREWWATVEALWDEAEYREERYAAIGLARHRRFADFQHPDLIEARRLAQRPQASPSALTWSRVVRRSR